MSEIMPAVVNVPEDETVSVWGNFYGTLQKKFFGCAEEVLGSMADFQKELVKHLDEITELNGEIAKRNANLAMKLSDFERDICHIRDYYDIIIASTKAVVDYGSDQKIIPHIRNLIEEKRYAEAKVEIDSFLRCLQKSIKSVEEDIESMQTDCPDLETVRRKIQQTLTASDELATAKQIQVNHSRVFRLGTSTLVYTLAGAATAGVVIASCMPQEASKLTDIVTSAGSEVLTFYTGSVLTGLQKVMDSANLSNELRKKAESSINEVARCLTGFFKQLNRFQSDINTIEKTINKLKRHMISLKEEVEEVDYKDVHTITVGQWRYVENVLQQMFGNFTHLNTRVIEKPTEGFSKEEFDAIMERLTRSVDLTLLGTPV